MSLQVIWNSIAKCKAWSFLLALSVARK